MTTGSDTVPIWDHGDFADFLRLERTGPTQFRNRFGDANARGRAFGGQLLAQALMATAATVPAGRAFTAMQFLFLQGAVPDRAITFDVTPLQDGKRFTSRRIQGLQPGGRRVVEAQATFSAPMEGPQHSAPMAAAARDERPEDLPELSDLPDPWKRQIGDVLAYAVQSHPALDLRFAPKPRDIHLGLEVPRPSMRFWVRARRPLPDDPALHAAVFAYLSDFWMNYCIVGAYVEGLRGSNGLYMASLNHGVWIHRTLLADEWLHFESNSPVAANGRGYARALVHDREGRLVATVTQEGLTAPRTE